MSPEKIKILKAGGVGIIPTDTVYGIACPAFNESALKRLFDIKGRDEDKPPIVLISSLKDLELFGVKIGKLAKIFIKKFWPGPISIIFTIKSELNYLDKGKGLAIRLPNDKKVLEFLKQTGPLATSSANFQGLPPAKNIIEAKKYFGGKVDFYEEGGELISLPSTLVRINKGQIEVLREGVVKVSI